MFMWLFPVYLEENMKIFPVFAVLPKAFSLVMIFWKRARHIQFPCFYASLQYHVSSSIYGIYDKEKLIGSKSSFYFMWLERLLPWEFLVLAFSKRFGNCSRQFAMSSGGSMRDQGMEGTLELGPYVPSQDQQARLACSYVIQANNSLNWF